MKIFRVTFWTLLLGLALASPALAQEGKKAAGHHGGQVTKTDEFSFEVVFYRNGIQIYGYDHAQAPLDMEDIKGSVNVKFSDSKRKPIEARLACVAGKRKAGGHGSGSYLAAKVNLSRVHEGKAEASFRLEALPGKAEKTATFEGTFRLPRMTEYVCPMACVKPLAEKGGCPKCGMSLKERSYIYACPMHAGVTSSADGTKCWTCGMKLVKVDSAAQGEDEGKTGKGHEGGGHGKHRRDGGTG